jgi:hypothetical protein
MKSSVKKHGLLVAEISSLTAVRTSPGYGVAGHAPQVFLHALRAYLKPAGTSPAERKCLTA